MKATTMLIAASIVALAGVAAMPVVSAEPGRSISECVVDCTTELPEEVMDCLKAIQHQPGYEFETECA